MAPKPTVHEAATISTELSAIPPHEARRRKRLATLCVFTALFGLLLGYAANNIEGAAQDARNYLPILFFGAAMLLSAVGLLVAAIVQGGRWIRASSLLVGYAVATQLIRAMGRISEILSGP